MNEQRKESQDPGSQTHNQCMCRAKRKCVFKHVQNAQIHSHPRYTCTQSLIRAFAFHRDILYTPMILLADNNGKADLGLRCPHMPEDTFSHGVTHMSRNVRNRTF